MSEENKRITIQYSIKLEDLASEVERLYAHAAEKLKALSLEETDADAILDSSVVKKVDEIRKELASTDLMLMDIQSIVSSYIQYEVSLSSPEVAEHVAEMATPPNGPVAPMGPATLTDLAEIISHVTEPA
jgi:leucyl aminopeptidase (aminopeptidase T)